MEALFAWQIFRNAEPAAIAICIRRSSIFPNLSSCFPPHPLFFRVPLTIVGSWRCFIDFVVGVVFGRTILLTFVDYRLPAAVLCVVFGTFSTKHFTLFIFATIALRFQVAFEVFVLSVCAKFHQCRQSAERPHIFTSSINLNVYYRSNFHLMYALHLLKYIYACVARCVYLIFNGASHSIPPA